MKKLESSEILKNMRQNLSQIKDMDEIHPSGCASYQNAVFRLVSYYCPKMSAVKVRGVCDTYLTSSSLTARILKQMYVVLDEIRTLNRAVDSLERRINQTSWSIFGSDVPEEWRRGMELEHPNFDNLIRGMDNLLKVFALRCVKCCDEPLGGGAK